MYVKLSDLNNDYKEQLFYDNNKIATKILDVEKIKIQSDYKELYYNIKLILIIVIFAIFAISLIIAKTKMDNPDILKLEIKDDKIDISEDDRVSVLTKGLKYINNCTKGILEKEIPKFQENNIPIISVIIPIYNANKTIKSVIRSIQNQNMTNYEIILINDCSKDNSLDIIYSLQKEDSRIKIMNNLKNMGTLYSRSVATLSAKGEYIFALDNDDLFISEDLLYIIYKIASQDDFDIVGFKSVSAPNYNPKINKIKDDGFYNHQHNLIVNQPKLGLFTISRNNGFHYNDVYIWGKTIKTEIYKKAINMMGKERYSIFVTWAEDSTMTFIIYNIANSLKFVRKYGIFHVRIDSCATFTQSNDIKTFGEIFLTDIIFEFSKNNTDKNYAAYQAITQITRRKFFSVQNNKKNSDYLKKILDKLYNSKYISQKNKNSLKEKYKKIQFYNESNTN